MAGSSATIRKKSIKLLGFSLLCAQFAGTDALARAGSGGLFSASSEWGVGAQIGNYAATGLSAEKMGFMGGAIDLALGVHDGTIGLAADYVRYLGGGLRLLTIGDRDGYSKIRGQLTPFFGGGLQVADGFGLRVPLGLEYTMQRFPFSVYGGIALYVGPFFADGGITPELWFNLGARVLL